MGIMALGPQDFLDYVNYDKQSLYSELTYALSLLNKVNLIRSICSF